MRAYYAFLAILMAGGLSGCRSGDSDDRRAMVEELRQLNRRLERMEQQMVQTQEQRNLVLDARLEALDKVEAAFFKKLDSQVLYLVSMTGGATAGGANAILLNRIPKPASWDDTKAVQAYLEQIYLLSRSQNSYSSNDPQVAMLAAIGEKNLELLLKMDKTDSFCWNNYTNEAIVKIAGKNSKELVLKYLPYRKELVKAVYRNNWLPEARKTLIDHLTPGEYVPHEWLLCLMKLKEPEVNRKLVRYFIEGQHRNSTYVAIKNLPGVDWDKVIPEMWKYARYAQDWERIAMAVLAARYGELDAMEIVLGNLVSKQQHYEVDQNAFQILGMLPEELSRYEAYEWFKKNRDRLTFDRKQQKFIQKKQ